MAILKTPDGTRLQVPDNATAEQVKLIYDAYVAQKEEAHKRELREMAWEDTPWYDRALIGFAKPFVQTGLGIKDLFTDLSQDEKAALEAGKGVKGVAGTTGEILGNVATFAVPGGAASQGGRAAARLLPQAMARAARIAPETAALAGMEALKAPTEERSRAEAALQGAAGAAGGAVLGKALSRAVKGVKQSPVAKKLMSEVDLTPGMASKGSFIPWLEQRMAALPFVGGRVANLQGKALEQWNRRTLQSVAPADFQISEAGKKGFQQLQKAFTDSYGAIWDQRIPLRFNPSQTWADLVPAVKRLLPKKEANRVLKNLSHADEVMQVANQLSNAGQVNGNVLSQIDDMLREFIQQARKQGDDQAVKFYQQARDSFRQALPDNVATALKHVDAQYAKYAIVQRAGTGKKALQDDSIFTPSDLLGAVKAKGSQRALSRGEGLLQEEASQAVKLFEDLVPDRNKFEQTIMRGFVGGGALLEPVGTSMALVGGLALPTEVMRKLMTGYYRGKPMALAKVLRQYGVTPSTVVTATGSATNDSGR